MLEQLESVVSRLNYLSPRETHPKSHIGRWGSGVPLRRPEQSAHDVHIHDCRAIAGDLSLDRQGFVLRRQPSRVTDFHDADEIRTLYYPEVERLVQEATGASRVVVFEHQMRRAAKARSGQDGVRPPFDYVHNDDTEKSVRERIAGLFGAKEAEALLAHRFATVGVWRPIVGPVYDVPLAVCDARTLASGDLVVTELVYADRTGELYSLRYNPGHRWYYVSAMQPDEVLLFKSFDSARDGRARFTAHSAFRNPACPPGARERESVEIRTLVFFEGSAEG